MKKYLTTLIVALVAVLASPAAFSGDDQLIASFSDTEARLVDDLSNISIYAGASYRVSDVDAGGALLGVAYDFDFASLGLEYGFVDADVSGVHEYNLVARKYMDFGGINPYALLGGGLVRSGSDSYGAAIAGAGLELELTNTIAAFAEYRYQWVFDEKDANTFVFGLTVRF